MAHHDNKVKVGGFIDKGSRDNYDAIFRNREVKKVYEKPTAWQKLKVWITLKWRF